MLRSRSDWGGYLSVVEADRIRMTLFPAVDPDPAAATVYDTPKPKG